LEPTRLNDRTVRKTVRKTVRDDEQDERRRSRQVGQSNFIFYFLFSGVLCVVAGDGHNSGPSHPRGGGGEDVRSRRGHVNLTNNDIRGQADRLNKEDHGRAQTMCGRRCKDDAQDGPVPDGGTLTLTGIDSTKRITDGHRELNNGNRGTGAGSQDWSKESMAESRYRGRRIQRRSYGAIDIQGDSGDSCPR
jgi:hypothetical protein